ncbi:MAG: WecB/TagA/CpsF family glycosyltransferase [Firmicutes bacterium]|nr:WecB/TagA/CpsF family glycosyltransferase [Bacillota bacterium]
MEDLIKVLGVKINKITFDGAVEKIKGFLEDKDSSKPKAIYTPNTEMVMLAKKDENIKGILNKGDMLIADGIGIVYASRIKKNSLPERVTGFDISVEMLKLANEMGYKVFLLGGQKGIAETASEKIREKYPNINICGYNHGFFKGAHIGHSGHEEEQKVIDKINKSKADILFVGLGAPKQEIWINENKEKLNCKVMIGNGGTIDILSGNVKLAPKIYRKMGLEWFYRLMKDPKRIKRQIVLPIFVLMVLFSREKIVE